MAREYVFRGEGAPFAPDPKEQREREKARLEAEQLVNRERLIADEDLAADAEVEQKIEDYQVGGLDSFGASASQPSPTADAAGAEQRRT